MAEVWTEAACLNNAEIDLLIWVLLDEQEYEAKARMVLRCFAV